MTPVAIVANGEFPSHPVPLAWLREARRIVCCDNGFARLWSSGFRPDDGQTIDIVGDCDSLDLAALHCPPFPLHRISEQDDNDLTKSFNWVLSHVEGPLDICLLGATGLREDHTLGNISLLMDYHVRLLHQRQGSRVRMVSDYGTFTPVVGEARLDSFPRQQVSVFSLTPDQPVTLRGLQYPLDHQCVRSFWQASLNAALGDHFSVVGGHLLVYQTHDAKTSQIS